MFPETPELEPNDQQPQTGQSFMINPVEDAVLDPRLGSITLPDLDDSGPVKDKQTPSSFACGKPTSQCAVPHCQAKHQSKGLGHGVAEIEMPREMLHINVTSLTPFSDCKH